MKTRFAAEPSSCRHHGQGLNVHSNEVHDPAAKFDVVHKWAIFLKSSCLRPHVFLPRNYTQLTRPGGPGGHRIEGPIRWLKLMKDKIQQNIDRILSWVKEFAPQTAANLNEPASESALALIESEFRIPLPVGFRELWRSFDGDGLDSWLAIFANGNQMLSSNGVLEHYKLEQEIGKSLYDPALHKVGLWKDRVADHVIFVKGAVKPLMLHPKWLPFSCMNGDVIRYFDFDPAPGGTVGQVIEVDAENCSYQVLADSLQAFLSNYAEQLESGAYTVDGDGYIESANDADPLDWGMPEWLRQASA